MLNNAGDFPITRRADPKSLSDEELAQICAHSRSEDNLLLGGCLGSIALVLLLVVDVLFVGTAIWPYFLGLMLILAAVFWAHDPLGRPKRPFRDELSYRCGTAPFSRYVEEAQAALDRHEADWVLLFTMAALPHGDRRWLQLELREGPPPSGEAELRISHPEQATFVRADKELTVDIAQELWTLLKDLDAAKLTDIPVFVKDGAPCRLAALRREPRLVVSASCNIAGPPAEHPQHPTAIFCFKLAGIAHHSFWRA